jgi:hypothetical protein
MLVSAALLPPGPALPARGRGRRQWDSARPALRPPQLLQRCPSAKTLCSDNRNPLFAPRRRQGLTTHFLQPDLSIFEALQGYTQVMPG